MPTGAYTRSASGRGSFHRTLRKHGSIRGSMKHRPHHARASSRKRPRSEPQRVCKRSSTRSERRLVETNDDGSWLVGTGAKRQGNDGANCIGRGAEGVRRDAQERARRGGKEGSSRTTEQTVRVVG